METRKRRQQHPAQGSVGWVTVYARYWAMHHVPSHVAMQRLRNSACERILADLQRLEGHSLQRRSQCLGGLLHACRPEHSVSYAPTAVAPDIF